MSYGLDASAKSNERGAKRAFSTSPTLTTSSDGEASERDALMGSDVLLVGAANHSGTHKISHRRHSTFDWFLGVTFLVIVALIWTFASVLVQYIFHNLSFQGPFFLTYVGISLFSVNLPLWYTSQVLFPKLKAWLRGLPTNGKLSHGELLRRSGVQASYSQIFRISAIISPLWFLANFTYNESLNLTSVSSSTIVSSTSTVFTFLLSVVALKEPFVWMKLAGVILCMAGNISTIFNDEGADGGTDHVFGDLVALFAAFMYGVYTTTIRRLIPDEESVSISLFFGFIGAINMVCLLPIVLAFHYSGIESLSGLSLEILVLIGLKGLFDNVLSDYLWARAVLLTSPTVATVGLSLTVPLAIVADFWFHGMRPTNVTLFASALVISGFVLINVGTKQNRHEYHPQRSTDRSDIAHDSRPRSNSAGGLGV
ncbi:Drug/Metabolite Transporter (DMT) Superfamily [Phytophthora infestans T30-4]|uniref:Drug/Metabolite Transporter (DMT) Superfamily n=2 Tax=Phytophthora infestans TaxID=4787 RepID=D0MU52_PHYIT|nr:Drug/Metabolite Transporter (DMT) Superfamily [Phytophthora infestans T30-4]EEY61499.1 Drug/Metabolite Transporter (DMT) Superfamily [Phytophthora infestans T30-4]KAF4150351.1 EamA-like transporter family [Phytophthora infestans]|eukprot:XP_002908416.1 Drug/Metabolite Transporter (DMT) Superfamily [Phytophthora infestans T30-4]